jgi:hypothetical protein
MISSDERTIKLRFLSDFLCFKFSLVDSALKHTHLVLILLLSFLEGKLQIGHVLSMAVYLGLQRFNVGDVRGFLFLQNLVMRITGKQLISEGIQGLYFLFQLCYLFLSCFPLLLKIFIAVFQLIILISESG